MNTNFIKFLVCGATALILILNTGCSALLEQNTTSVRAPASSPSPTATGNGSVTTEPIPPSTSTATSSSKSVHLRLGNPSKANATDPNNYLMQKPQYVLSYNRSKGIPNWVSWQLNSSWTGNIKRRNDFRPDPALPDGWYRVTGAEYRDSGYDRGHMVPSSDRTNTRENNSATFLMTNIVPQAPDNNQGYWRELEEYGRDLVEQGKELYIIAGGYGEKETLAGGKVSVPARLYKIIVVTDPSSGVAGINKNTRVIAIDTPNIQGQGDWQDFKTTVDAIEKKTGYDFLSNVSRSVQAAIESKVDTEAAASKSNSNKTLINSPLPTQNPQPISITAPSPQTTTTEAKNCSPAYTDVCIPAAPPDLDCNQISERNFTVLPPDPHNFDGRDKDGIGCEE